MAKAIIINISFLLTTFLSSHDICKLFLLFLLVNSRTLPPLPLDNAHPLSSSSAQKATSPCHLDCMMPSLASCKSAYGSWAADCPLSLSFGLGPSQPSFSQAMVASVGLSRKNNL